MIGERNALSLKQQVLVIGACDISDGNTIGSLILPLNSHYIESIDHVDYK